MGTTHLELGKTGEDAVLAFYVERGYTLVARNWRCRIGELDLIVARRGILVFCEVKTRRGARFGGGYEAVGRAKREKIRRVASAFLQQADLGDRSVRFDVASVLQQRDGEASIEVFVDAF